MIRVIGLILICQIAFAQKTRSRSTPYPINEIKAQSYSFPSIDFPDNEKQIAEYLSRKITNLSNPSSSLKLLYIKESPGGKHYCFQQNINNIEVYHAQIKVNVLHNKKTVSSFATTYSPDLISTENFPDPSIPEQFIQNQNEVSKSESTKVYYFHQEKLVPAYLIYIEKRGCLSYEYILNNSGEMLSNKDLLSYSGKKDTTAVFNIFNPDPLTSAQTVYGAPYADNNNTDNPSLNKEMLQKRVNVKFENDTFFLENNYYKIANLDLPNTEPAVSKIDSFNFNRSQSGFEDVNSFYHINAYRNHVKSLGFNNLVDFILQIDPHAHSGGDNSSFNEFSSPVSLLFGDGGVDDAEDADVVVHEFGHGISAAAAPFSNNGSERAAIDEGFGDYIAASYSRSLNEYRWEDVFSWDGHNEFWAGRSTKSTKHYPENRTYNKWKDGEMWSSTLMQLQDDINPNTLDSIIYQALYGQAQNTTMPDAAQLIIDADTALFQGKHTTILHSRFADRGFFEKDTIVDTTEIITEKNIAVFNTYSFSKGGALTVAFNTPVDATIELFDVTGRLIEKSSYTNITQIDYLSNNINSGVYFLRTSTYSNSLTINILRY